MLNASYEGGGVMIKFFTRKKVRKTGCISVGYIVCAHVGHYVKEVKSDV